MVLLSPERGKLRTVARGVRRVKSRLRGRLEPFCRVELVLHRGRELDLITSVSVVAALPELRSDLDRLLGASMMVNAVDAVGSARTAVPVALRSVDRELGGSYPDRGHPRFDHRLSPAYGRGGGSGAGSRVVHNLWRTDGSPGSISRGEE